MSDFCGHRSFVREEEGEKFWCFKQMNQIEQKVKHPKPNHRRTGAAHRQEASEDPALKGKQVCFFGNLQPNTIVRKIP